VDDSFFTDPLHVVVRRAITAAGGASTATDGPNWGAAITEACGDLGASALVAELAVEPLRINGDPDARYVSTALAGVQWPVVEDQVAELKSKLQRTNPEADSDAYMKLFGRLLALEERLRGLKERAAGAL
ncbi:MAG: DNA primase, partial [Stackebrandtia sp.]